MKLLDAIRTYPRDIYGFDDEERADLKEAEKRIVGTDYDQEYRMKLLQAVISAHVKQAMNDCDLS